MTVDEFRLMALSFPEASEGAHMNHPDFRVRGRIFATLHYPDEQWGMVKLPPEEQEVFIQSDPAAFVPVKGGWGRQGCTNVRLEAVKKTALRRALALAWRNAGRKKVRKTGQTAR
ncbi:MAG: MmcQ/YjbR family DNA-binding protein [Bryobacteraceae bacterium]